MTLDPNDFLMSGGGGVPAFSFGGLGAPPGAGITGKITDLQTSQQTDFDTREPLTWPNGDPKMQLEITLQTTLQDSTIEDDDGRRRVFIKGKGMTEATRDAVLAVGAKGLEIGGTFTITYTHETKLPGTKKSYREYKATYERPNASAAFLGTAQPEAASAVAPQPAAAAPEGALAAALANLSPEVKAALLAQAKAG